MNKPDYSLKNLDPYTTSFLIALPVIGVLMLLGHIYWEGFNPSLLIWGAAIYALTVFAISGGYHRLFAHRTYKTNSIFKLFYLIFGAASGQNSALKWATDHRVHHRKADTDQDPYNIKRGFFFAHMGWVLLKDQAHIERPAPKDLMKDPLVMWQHRNVGKIALISNFIICLIAGYFSGSYIGAFAIVGFLRLVVVLQVIFCINSFCHMIGTRPYNKKETARDSHLLAFITFGEAYHNFHHTFESDYRNGYNWYEWDPTKWIVSGLSKLGITYDLIKTPKAVVQRTKENAKATITTLYSATNEKIANQ
jgi:stearoyl-CoA desaturase (delta-9 desaturase)